MNLTYTFFACILAASLIGCSRQDSYISNQQIAELTKERDRERTARLEAESRTKVLVTLAVVGCASALFLGIALGSSVRRRSLRQDDK
jgi:hypothetical protein